MEQFLYYTLESAICMVLFFGLYHLVFRNNTFFKINRYYLLISLLFSLLIPLLNVSLSIQPNVYVINRMLEPVTVSSDLQAEEAFIELTTWQWILYIYLTITLFFFVLFIIRISQIVKLIRRHKVNLMNGVKLVEVDDTLSPASFFNYVFMPKGEQSAEILHHEKVHIKQAHTIDHILLEVLAIFMWFNPMLWIYRSTLRMVHEYLADEDVLLSGCERQAYQKLLIDKSFGYKVSELAINFNYSPLKKRLIMITKNKTKKTHSWKYLLILPVMAATLLYFGCETKNDEATENLEKLLEEPVVLQESKLKEEIEEMKQIEPDEETFVIVEKMPSFKGGNVQGFREYISENLQYPEEAIEKKLSGRVYVQFTVKKDGEVGSVSLARGVHPVLDNEAMRVIKSSPKWEAGVQKGQNVNVKFTYPVNFVLE